jgi:hypothetical protein
MQPSKRPAVNAHEFSVLRLQVPSSVRVDDALDHRS